MEEILTMKKKKIMISNDKCHELLRKIKSTGALHADKKKAKIKLADCENELMLMQQLRGKKQDLIATIGRKEAKIAKKRRKLAQVENELSQTDTIGIAEELQETFDELQLQLKEESCSERKKAELEGKRNHLISLISSYDTKTQVRPGSCTGLLDRVFMSLPSLPLLL